jgi:hypothetical protein
MLAAEPLPSAVREEIAAVLTGSEMTLFLRLPPQDQWHGYGVLTTLKEAGYTHPKLQAASLLHDVGKSRAPLSMWERTLIVLSCTFFPRLATIWGQGEPRGWRRPFVVKAQHPAWGAELAREVGSSDLTVTLIRRHQDVVLETSATEGDLLLRQLQWADNLN